MLGLKKFDDCKFKDEHFVKHLKGMLEEFCQGLKNHDIEFTPYRSKELIHFSKLPLLEKKRVFKEFENYFNIMNSVLTEGDAFISNQRSIWSVLGSQKWRVPDDYFSNLSKEHVIEIYTAENKQIFRNHKYFKCSSYSLEELIVYPWSDLIEHSEDNLDTYMSVLNKIFVEQRKEIFHLDLPPSIAFEKNSFRQLKARTNPQFISPITDLETKQNVGYSIVWDIEIIGSQNLSRDC